MKKMLPVTDLSKKTEKVFDQSNIPKEFDIFYRSESYFIGLVENYENLSDQEKKSIQNKYRFDPYRPGIYQGITGYSNMF